MAAQISMTVTGMDKLLEKMEKMEKQGAAAALGGLHNFMDYVENISQRVIPVDTGNMAQHERVIKTSEGGHIINDAPYARPVFYGYARHLIRPVRRKALRWEVGRVQRLTARRSRKSARYAFSRGHYVPATKSKSTPNPWLKNALDAARPQLKAFILEPLKEIHHGG